MAEPGRIPLTVALPSLPSKPEECPAWAARITAALVSHFRRFGQATATAIAAGGGSASSPTLLSVDKLNVAGGQTSLPASAPAASPPTFLSITKWCND